MTRLTRYHLCGCLSLLLAVAWAPGGRAMEPLSIQDLVANCEYLRSDPGGVYGQYCIRYIQGFVDGAVETDARIMQDLAGAQDGGSSLTQRAMRTRMPRRGDQVRPGSLAGFCLGDSQPLFQVVDTVVTDLLAQEFAGPLLRAPASGAVNDALQRHFPCPG